MNTEGERFELAARSIRAWMACVVLFIGTVMASAPAEKLTIPSVVTTVALNALLLFYSWRIATAVARGEQLVTAAVILILYGVLGAVVVTATAGRAFLSHLPLAASAVALAAADIFALVAVLRAAPDRPDRQ